MTTTILPLALLNAPVLTNDGKYEMWTITFEEALTFGWLHGVESYIGHASTAALLSTLLGVEVQQTCAEFRHQVHQMALVFALNQTQPEGTILTEEQIKAVGYSLRILQRRA